LIARAAIVLSGVARDCDKLSQAVLMTRAEPLRHAHLHRRQQTKPRANVPTSSVPFSTTPSPLQSGQVFHTRRTIC